MTNHSSTAQLIILGLRHLDEIPAPAARAELLQSAGTILSNVGEEEWMRRRALSPLEMWNRDRQRPCPIPPAVICDLLGGDLAREVKCSKGFLRFEDEEIRWRILAAHRYCLFFEE